MTYYAVSYTHLDVYKRQVYGQSQVKYIFQSKYIVLHAKWIEAVKTSLSVIGYKSNGVTVQALPYLAECER